MTENITDTANYAKTQEDFLKEGFFVYNNDKTFIIFDAYEKLQSGFLRITNYKCFGRIHIGLENSNFSINPALITIIHPKQKALFREFIIDNKTSVRYYFEDKEYEANDNLSPNRIISSIKIKNLICLILKCDLKNK